MSIRSQPATKIALAFVGIYVIWGTTYLAIALSLRSLPPFTSGSLRFLAASALMFVWLRMREPRTFEGIDFKRAALCGVLLTGFGNGLVVWAQQGVPSGIAALLVAAIPVVILIIECLFFRGRMPAPRALAGMFAALIGVVIIVTHTRNLAGAVHPVQVAAILLAVVSWSFGTLFQRQAQIQPRQILGFTCAQIFFGGVAQFVLALANTEWRVLRFDGVSLTSALALAYLLVFGSIVALSCYSFLLTKVAAQKVATYALVNPVVALILGGLILNEKLDLTAMLAALAVVVGIACVLFPASKSKRLDLPPSTEREAA